MRTTAHFCRLLLLGPSILSAQARPDTAATQLDSLAVTASRTPGTAAGTGTIIVRPDALPFPAPPTAPLSDLLRAAPFVQVRQNSRGEHELSIRGSDSRQTTILVEGIPITLGWDSRVDPALVPLTGVRQLTITRGLSSVLDGPNALGGTVEFAFTAPVAAPLSKQRDLTAAMSLDGYGAWSASLAGGTRLRTGLGTVATRGGLGRRSRDGFALSRDGGAGGGTVGGTGDPGRNGDGRLRSNSDLDEVSGFVSARLHGGLGRYLGITITGLEADRGVPAELHIAMPRWWRYPAISRRLVILSAGSGVVGTPWGSGSLTASVGRHTGRSEIETYTDPTYTTIAAREFGDERTATARLLGTHSLGAGGLLRVAYTWSEIRYDERFDDAPATRYRQRLGSAGVETVWALGGDTQLAAGLVHDRGDTPESGGRQPLGRLNRWGWRVGASTTGFGGGVRWHASLSRRVRFPALRELYSGALNRFDPNPDLKPEALLGAEIGATVSGGRLADLGVTLQGVVFHHRLDDAVVRVTLPDRRFRRINRDALRSSGLELVADWSSKGAGAGAATGAVTIGADLTVQRVRLHDRTLPPGEPNVRRAEHTPELRGSLDIGVPLPLGTRGSGMMRLTGRQFCQHPDLGLLVELGPQIATNVALMREWRPASRSPGIVRAIVAVDNLADATVYDQCGLPQPGRTVRIGLELR